jgi:hypothetical protein
MTTTRLSFVRAAAFAVVAGSIGLPDAALAQAKPAKPKATRPAAKKPPAAPALPEATPEQIEAATLVFYGRYDCELNQAIDVTPNSKRAGYIDVKHGKLTYLMKPVLSSTGAVRLEDVKGQTLVVQIANKSMLMDVKAGRRLVDECVSARQRELIEAAAKLKAQEAAVAAAQAASAAAAAAVAASGAALAASAAADAASAIGAAASAPAAK